MQRPTYKSTNGLQNFAYKIILTHVYRYLSASARTFAPTLHFNNILLSDKKRSRKYWARNKYNSLVYIVALKRSNFTYGTVRCNIYVLPSPHICNAIIFS